MKMVSQSENLDGIKLVVAVILLFISILLMLRPMQTEAISQARLQEGELRPHDLGLPGFPKSDSSYQPDDRMDDEAGMARPQEQHDDTARPAVEEQEKSEEKVPPMPESPVRLYYSVQDKALLSMDGEVIYRLDSDANQWSPVIPDGMLEQLSDRTQIERQDGEWVITETQQITRFRWDEAQMAWVLEEAMEEDAIDSHQAEKSVSEDNNEERNLNIAMGICPMPLDSKLSSGITVNTLRWLNLRSEPGMAENILKTNPPGTQLDIIGGPECTPHQNHAYLWWQVQSADGVTGWSAEGSLYGKDYFLEPVK